ncbi:MAG: sugar phosphate nucleotidyltransferase [Bacteroidia bacterium]|nr:sugar phosphate nucleotidyltransferase [Bacteroidia bacterium]
MNPSLIILAAGKGSRYGSMKQLDAVGPSGETLMDYSVFDAILAGIERVVFIIREEDSRLFRENILEKYAGRIQVEFAFQRMTGVPGNPEVPVNRSKPWGTGQAVLSAEILAGKQFIVINADDFYGYESFRLLTEYLCNNINHGSYAMIGFPLAGTLSENGPVSRALCQVAEDSYLTGIVEKLRIKKTGDLIFPDENGVNVPLSGSELVSMNMWGFNKSIFPPLQRLFNEFIRENKNNAQAEFILPAAVNAMIREGSVKVRVLPAASEWFGITYREDKPEVMDKIRQLIAAGNYPANLFCKG